jgi:hypothetical protein
LTKDGLLDFPHRGERLSSGKGRAKVIVKRGVVAPDGAS